MTVNVTKKVIVSAGAIESPKLLMLSGIGHKEYLESVGIDVVKDFSGVGVMRNPRFRLPVYQPTLLGPSLHEVCSASSFVFFMTMLDWFIQSKESISGVRSRVTPVTTPASSYDFVIIGCGGAGSVVASRLSENPEWTVLCLEAGHDEPVGTQIPSFASRFLATEVGWNYTTTNESYACLANGGSCSWPAGKNLGGSTAHSGMIYMRGNPTDFNNWNASGATGWSYDDVLPYFKKAENNGDINRVGTTYHGTGGPQAVERFQYYPALDNAFLEAANQSGIGVTEDFNGNKPSGFSRAQFTAKDGVRRSSARSYLWPAKNRTNLAISLNSQATRIIFDNLTAVAVEYYKNGTLTRVNVTKEVILSAGVMRSPHVLLHSGVGPTADLEKLGIDVVKDLPGVGENVRNHITYVLNYTINENDTYENNWAAVTQYLAFQNGPLSSVGASNVVGTMASNATTSDYPDLIVYPVGYLATCGTGELNALRSNGKRAIAMLTTYTHTKSKGRITLKSNNPLDGPMIHGNQLSDPADVAGLVAGINVIEKLVATKALQAYNFTLANTKLAACSNYTFKTDEYWACAVRQNPYPENHQAGSCKMGPSSDTLAVVDVTLKVHGLERIRVIDASIMPTTNSGSPGSVAVMIGERGASMINATWHSS